MPEGEITQRVGEEFCKRICNMYPEVFNNEKGNFLGANATMILKPGGLEKIKQSGFRPAAKFLYGLEAQFEEHLDRLYEDLVIVDGKDLITASQIVPVIEMVDGVRKLKRLAINYKSTVNDHLQDIPDVFTTCNDEFQENLGLV